MLLTTIGAFAIDRYWANHLSQNDKVSDDLRMLQYNKEAKDEFRHNMFQQYRSPLRWLFRCAFLLNLLFIPIDYGLRRKDDQASPWEAGELQHLIILRVCAISPLTIFLAGFVDSKQYSKWANQGRLTYYTIAGGIFGLGVCLILYIWISSTTLDQDPWSRSSLVILYVFIVYALTPLTVRTSTIVSSTLVVAGLAVLSNLSAKSMGKYREAHADSSSGRVQTMINSVVMILCCFAVICYNSYTLEKSLTQNLIQLRIIKSKQRELKEEEGVNERLLCSMMPKFLVEELKRRTKDMESINTSAAANNNNSSSSANAQARSSITSMPGTPIAKNNNSNSTSNSPTKGTHSSNNHVAMSAVLAEDFDEVTVLFCLLSGFGRIVTLPPDCVVQVKCSEVK